MTNIFDPLSIPLGKLMHFIYYTVSFENYGLALVIFTVLTRLVMLPLTIKQYQGTAKMQKLNPKLEELKRQYGSDKKRLQEETMKLYQEEKVNPAGGCLPMLIQFPILFSLYPVITRPLRYMLGKSQEQIAALQELYKSISGSTASFVQEMEVLNFFKNDPTSLARAQANNLLVPSDLINMRFFGLDLSITPTYSPDLLFGAQSAIYLPLLLIPIIGVLSTFISGKFAMASSAASSAQNPQASSMGKSMQFLGPVMTLIFSFQLPSGVLIYWIAGYMIQIVQQLFINKYVLKLDNIFTGKKTGGDTPQPKGRQRIAGPADTGAQQALPENAQGKGSAGQGKGSATQGKSSAAQATGLVNYSDTGAGPETENGSDGERGGLYDGGSMVNKVISAVGGTGGIGARDHGPGGLVHGGMFKPGVKIPGVTDTGDDIEFEDEAGADPDGAAPSDDGATGGGDAATGKPSQPGDQAGRCNTDTRSNTQKNYGTQKKHKKKK